MAVLYKNWVIELKNKADVIIDLLGYYDDGKEMVKQARRDVDRSYENAAIARTESEIDSFEGVVDRYWQMLSVTRNNHPHIEARREVSIKFEYLDKIYSKAEL
jgi:hypothetical protein